MRGFVKVDVSSNALAGLMYYMKERERIRLAKEAGKPKPWTGDAILQTYKFTNVKRAHDKTTKAFVKFYKENWNPKHDGEGGLLYNCGVARYFGTTAFQRALGWQLTHDPFHIRRTAKALRKRGESVFTGAYIVTAGGQSGPKENVVARYLSTLWKEVAFIVGALRENRSWRAAYICLTALPGFGGSGFMAKEVLQDYLLMTKLPVDDALIWTPVGPGARRGVNRIYSRPPLFRQPELAFIDEVTSLHHQLRQWWKKTYPKAEELTAHDVQFCLCEFDKYERTRLGQGRPKTKYDGGAR